jgi:hypothetical protein
MKHRTALITAGSIAAVVFAGAIAVGANLGILTVADSRPVGELSAATVIQASGPQPAQQYAATPAKKPTDSQKYVIKKAGAVNVAFTKTSVRLVDVSAKKHWKWELAQTGDKKLTVTFKHGSNKYTFVASVGSHGKITARVDHPITKVTPAASSSGSTTWIASPAPSAPRAASPAHSGGGEPGDSHEGGGQDD